MQGVFVYFLVDPNGLSDLVADFENRIEGGERLLENHGDAIASDMLQVFLFQLQQVFAGEKDATPRNFARRLVDEAENAEGRDGLAAPGFAHQADGFLASHLETDAVDGFRHAVFGAVKVDLEVLDR